MSFDNAKEDKKKVYSKTLSTFTPICFDVCICR